MRPVRLSPGKQTMGYKLERKVVSFLARPHGTGAQSTVADLMAVNEFQSSPVRIGRAL